MIKKIPPEQNFVDYKGWRFRPPYRCMCCGVMISIRQFCFGRACGPCDCGQRRYVGYRVYSGPRELIDPKDPYFIEEDRWSNPPEGLEAHSGDKEFPEREEFELRLLEQWSPQKEHVTT